VASTDVDIACHHGGNEGTLATASAPSGSKIAFDWTYVSCYGTFLFELIETCQLQLTVAWG